MIAADRAASALTMVPAERGDEKVGQGFTVSPSGLETGSQLTGGLQSRCELIAEYVVTTLAAMAGSAGHADLESALKAAASKGDRAYTDMWAAYGHASQGLATSAHTYANADQSIAGQAGALMPGGPRGGLQP
jgi:hypothetical protein